MIDEQLGLAAGAWLRESDRPPAHTGASIHQVMAEVGRTHQVRSWPPGPSSFAMLSVGVGLIGLSGLIGLVLVTALVLAAGRTAPMNVPGALPTASVEPGVHWVTDIVDLAAESVSIEANDRVSYAQGPFFRTSLGEAFEDDVRIELSGDGGPDREANRRRVAGVLTILGMRLSVAPRALTDLAALPAGERLQPRLSPFMKGQPLHCRGILFLPPAEAHERLLDAGYAIRYHLMSEPDQDDCDPTRPPDGVIESAALDSRYGIVILSVDDGPDPVDPLPRCSQGD
jgi:hypothetical protein